jgi:hypothetical protein
MDCFAEKMKDSSHEYHIQQFKVQPPSPAPQQSTSSKIETMHKKWQCRSPRNASLPGWDDDQRKICFQQDGVQNVMNGAFKRLLEYFGEWIGGHTSNLR